MGHPGRPLKCDPKVDNLRSNIRLGNIEVAKTTLKEFGIDAFDSDGRTALINSVIENKFDFMCWLIENGGNVNYQDRIGYSALHFAAQNNLASIAKHLLQKAANPNLQDIHGNTPLWTAIFNAGVYADKQDTVKILLKAGADINVINKHDNTPRLLYKTFHNKDIETLDLS